MRVSRDILLGVGVLACALLPNTELIASDAGDPQETQIAQCSRWVTTEIPHSLVPDPSAFCANDGVPRTGSWNSSGPCSWPGIPASSRSLYCASAGQEAENMVLVAAYHTPSSNGQELVDESEPKDDSKSSLAEFFTESAIRMGDLRLVPGFYILRPSHSPAGWNLNVNRTTADQIAEEDPQSYVGNVQMKAEKIAQPEGRLRIFFWPGALPSAETASTGRTEAQSLQEANSFRLHLEWGSTDVSISVSRDVPPLDK